MDNKVINKMVCGIKEFVKILDLAGDFYYQVRFGKVQCYQGGHQLSNNFLNYLLIRNFLNSESRTVCLVKNIESIFKPKQQQ